MFRVNVRLMEDGKQINSFEMTRKRAMRKRAQPVRETTVTVRVRDGQIATPFSLIPTEVKRIREREGSPLGAISV